MPSISSRLALPAGGVEALIELFQNLSASTGMAYVLVTHLSSEHKSHLAEILDRQTSMPVLEIANGVIPEPDRVYVAKPGTLVRLRNGAFEVEPQQDRPLNPIDVFFRSLAASQKNRAIAVVLSGMDGDGAQGMRAIKGEGGITIAQSPESARYPDMPRTTILSDHAMPCFRREASQSQLERLGDSFGPGMFNFSRKVERRPPRSVTLYEFWQCCGPFPAWIFGSTSQARSVAGSHAAWSCIG